jgi:hypothetical protein
MSLKYRSKLVESVLEEDIIALATPTRSLFLGEKEEVFEVQTVKLFKVLSKVENKFAKKLTFELDELGDGQSEVQTITLNPDLEVFEVYEHIDKETEPTDEVAKEEIVSNKSDRKVIKG